jgi:hypothetical protein
LTSGPIYSSIAASSASRAWTRRARITAAVFVPCNATSPPGAWAELGRLVDRLWCGQLPQSCAQVVGGGEHQVAELDDRADPRRASRSLGDQQRTQLLGVRVTRLRSTLTTTRQRAASGLDRVELVSLAAHARRSRSSCFAGCSPNLLSTSRAASIGSTEPHLCRSRRGPSRSGSVAAKRRSSGLHGSRMASSSLVAERTTPSTRGTDSVIE